MCKDMHVKSGGGEGLIFYRMTTASAYTLTKIIFSKKLGNDKLSMYHTNAWVVALLSIFNRGGMFLYLVMERPHITILQL